MDDQSLMFVMDLSGQRRSEQTYQVFLTDLSHEMRTPLTAILAHLEVLRTPDVPEATRDQSLSLIYRETNRIVRLTRDLLKLGRLEMASEIARRPIDIVVLAEEAVSQIIPQAEERQIALSLQADASLPHVLGDPDRLKQVFLNLLDNAVKYCRPGDQVEVCLHSEPDGVGCTIRDTGPGIPPQHLPHVTRRLYRVNTDVEGSGLGLTLAEEILRRHQSRLDIHSQHEGEPTGTVLHFILPTVSVEKVV
ncbi:MAG TPA: ATP-binding protein [Anaerolineae bacterium]|nr:ATP-binding protein [Anaerolineae bacterium]